MKFPKKEFLDPKREKTVKTYITIFTILTIVPSVYLAYNIVKRTIWEKTATQFLTTQMEFPRTQLISSVLTYDPDSARIEVTLIGERISDEEIEILSRKMGGFNLRNTYLQVRQSGDSGADLNMLRSDILKDLYERNELLIQDKDQKIALLERELAEYARSSNQVLDIAREAKVNHPGLQNFSMNRAVIADLQKDRQDTLLFAYAKFRSRPNRQEQQRFQEWLKLRTKADSVALILQ